MPEYVAFRSSILHLLDDPGHNLVPNHCEYFPDGIMVVKDGHIYLLGPAEDILPQIPAECPPIQHFPPDHLIIPGMIDTHIHYPQTDMIASYGEQLLHWLETYTFPTERKFESQSHAAEVADFFLKELLRNGTTTAVVFGTVHPQSVDAFFEAAESRGLRMIAGKVLMDRNCPEYLQDTPQSGYDESKKLIEKWHGRGRLSYAVTPRFAPTSTDEQLAKAGQLLKEYPDVYLHTHVAENKDEVAWVRKLFPKSRSYLDVYKQHGLLRPRSVMAHCIHLDDEDKQSMGTSGAAASFCPTSNLFIGSGLFDLHAAKAAGMRVGLGTDVGAGSSFSLLQTMNEGYKVTQMLGKKLSPYQSLYLATLGGARALYLDDKIGNFTKGKEADFVVFNFSGTPLLQRRLQCAKTIHEKLFALMMLGDDRSISATYIMGKLAMGRKLKSSQKTTTAAPPSSHL